MKKHTWIFALVLGILAFEACKEKVFVPKPVGFPRIDIPKTTKYKTFNEECCPFTFEYPDYGVMVQDKLDSCWFDLHFAPYNCRWHITYKNLQEEHISYLAQYEDYRQLIYKHSKKATQITEDKIQNSQGKGIKFEITGQVATPEQIIFTDSTQNVIMTSFYFFTALENDSLQPVITYMKSQLDHMVNTVKWKE